MNNTIIKVENLSKQYRLGELGTGTISHDLNRWWSKIRGKEDPYLKIGESNDRTTKGNSDYVWALKDVNFEVKEGEAIGIIGKNGAGKSTLLKLLSRITAPTTGTIKTRGRIASLLEVGTGFHEELTGRENIFLNGAILGMTKAEIRKNFDEIVAFSGTERYIDTPVKRYSSGMRVRLAFAVAAYLEPEILIVDEVLAVGDAEFQKKAIGKMQDVSQNSGRTVLFVSHNMQAVTSLTEKCIFMKHGMLHNYNTTPKIVNQYLQDFTNSNLVYKAPASKDVPQITQFEVVTSEPNNVQAHGSPFEVIVNINSPRAINGAIFSFQIVNSSNIPVLHFLTMDSEIEMCREEGNYMLKCVIPSFKLYPGQYSFNFNFDERVPKTKFHREENICPFEVVVLNQTRDFYWYPNNAVYVEDHMWNINKLDTSF
jgi:lipopolysaccharide transport system ATP-binding protein